MRIAAARCGDDRVALTWSDGATSEFHYVWLRSNCRCPQCRHPEAWERLLDQLDVSLDIVPDEVTVDEGLTFTWPDGHRTGFSAQWLHDHAYEPEARAARCTRLKLWDAASIAEEMPEVDHQEVMGDDEALRDWLRLIRDYGFSIVRNVPQQVDAVIDLARRIAFVQETNFGRSFEVVSKPDPENLAYTAVKLTAHTDVPNRRGLPGLQFLHCIEHSADGGESILVDGYAAAERLKARYPDDFELLAAVLVPYRFQDAATDIENHVPVIGLGVDGEYTEIRFHNALLAPLDLDPQLVVPFYRAFQNFGRFLLDPAAELLFKMEPGDCQVFDNRRVLHARSEFDPNSGARHLQGCYVDRDDFMSRLTVLERNGSDFRTS